MADNDIPSLYPGAVLMGRRRYVIERVLGEGGFGITYLANTEITVENIRVTARMAIKEHFVSLYNERGADNVAVTTPGSQKVRDLVANSMKDFLGEARRLQQLGAGHPNIVKVNEVFEANGTAYYVMEYLDGSSLWKSIDGRPMSEADMLAMMRPVVDAVAYLHRNRLTHLDIKPQNIMLAADATGAVRPVLIDFGLSKHYDAEGHATSTINTLACSDGYSPAEQYSGITTFTPSADVYALGATMLACLTGKTPQKSTEWSAGKRIHYLDTLPVSPQLRDALRGALADGEQRFPDASALLAALPAAEPSQAMERRFSTSAPDQATPAPDQATPAPDQAFASSAGADASQAPERRFVTSADQATPTPDQAISNSPLPADPNATQVIGGSQNTPASAYYESSEPKRGRKKWLILGAIAAVMIIGAIASPIIYDYIDKIVTEKSDAESNHSVPWNRYLAVERDSMFYYYSQYGWSKLGASERESYNKLGVVISNGITTPFILSLDLIDEGCVTWEEAMAATSGQLPNLDQGYAIAAEGIELSEVLERFGASGYGITQFWTSVLNEDSTACYIDLDHKYELQGVPPYERHNAHTVMPIPANNNDVTYEPEMAVAEVAAPEAEAYDPASAPAEAEAYDPAFAQSSVWNNHRRAENLYLAVQRDGRQYYFSQRDWNALGASQQAECRKLGVVIKKDGQKFILALEDDPGEYTWDEAMSHFGNRLPTKQQGQAWISQRDAVQSAVCAFGGHMPGPNDMYFNRHVNDNWYYSYWTKTQSNNSSFICLVGISNGYIFTNGRYIKERVRLVSPIVE